MKQAPETKANLPLSHHALLVRGERALALLTLETALGITFTTVPDVDISYVRTESLGIDDVRDITFRSLKLPIKNDFFRIIVDADAVTHEAQNALLKLTEDPPLHARFIFILPHSFPIIATLRSRFVEYVLQANSTQAPQKQSLKERLKDVLKMTKDKDETGMEALLTESENRVHEARASGTEARALLTARRYIEARGASAKMLLEHLVIAEREAELR